VLILGGLEGEQSPPCASSEIGQHLIQGGGVDGGIHPAGTVRRHLPPPILQAGDEGIVAIITLGNVIECLIILNPEGDVPGLPVCPTVESGGGGGGVHWFGLNCDYPTASRPIRWVQTLRNPKETHQRILSVTMPQNAIRCCRIVETRRGTGILMTTTYKTLTLP
jgi:hypothetical protein